MLVDLRQSRGVVLGEFDALPEFGRRVGALDRLEAEVEDPCGWGGADRGVAGIGEGTGLSTAEAGDIVFISTEVLGFRCPVVRGWLTFFNGSFA